MIYIFLSYVNSGFAFKSLSRPQAGETLQRRFIKSLSEQLSTDDYLNIYTMDTISSFPKTSKLFVNGSESILGDRINLKKIAYVNVVLLKNLSVMFAIIKELLSLLLVHKNSNFRIITYNTHYHYSLPSRLMNKLFSDKFKNFVLLVDMPEHFVYEKKRTILYRLEDLYSKKNFCKCDGFITMVDSSINDFCSIDRIFNFKLPVEKINVISSKPSNKLNDINLVFVGALEDYYGIKELLNILEELPNNYNFHFFGSGELSTMLKSEKNNIVYHGFVDEKQLYSILNFADGFLLFIKNKKLHKYQIPSKLFLYLQYHVRIFTNYSSNRNLNLSNIVNFIESDDVSNWAYQITTSFENSDVQISGAEKNFRRIFLEPHFSSKFDGISKFLK